MSNFSMLMWISLIVILVMRSGHTMADDELCMECGTDKFAECPIHDENFSYNNTVNCDSTNPDCLLAVDARDSNADGFVCRLSHQSEMNVEHNSVLEPEIQTEQPKDENIETPAIVVEASKEVEKVEEGAENIEEKPETNNPEITEPETTKPDFVSMPEANIEPVEEIPIALPVDDETTNPIISTTLATSDAIPDYVNDQSAVPDHNEENAANSIIDQESNDIFNKPSENMEETTDKKPATDTQHVAEEEPQINTVEVQIASVAPSNTEDKALLSCYTCSSSSDVNCAQKPTEKVNCKAPENLTNGCYILYTDSQIQRGCLADLQPNGLEACLDAMSQEFCLLCHSDNCNDVAMNVSTTIQLKIVTLNHSDMVVCKGNACGDDLRQENELHCHQCSGGERCNAEQKMADAKACPASEINHECFFYADLEYNMHRGCTTSTKEYELCRSMGEKRCVTCNHTTGCNSRELMSQPQLHCSHCDTRLKRNSLESLHCAYAQNISTIKKCEAKFPYYFEESCQMIYQADVDLAIRDCTLDFGRCEPLNPWCRTCNTANCNNHNLKNQSCLQCSSTNAFECLKPNASFPVELCKNSDSTVFEKRGCFTLMDRETNVTTRGCVSDLTEEGFAYCKKHIKSCILCYEQDGCNDQLAPSSAGRLDSIEIPFLWLLTLSAISTKVLYAQN